MKKKDKKYGAQPAEVNYFFKDGYIEFWDVIVITFQRCGRVITDCWRKVRDYFLGLIGNAADVISREDIFGGFFRAIGCAFMFGLSLGRLILSAVFTPIICTVMSLLQAVGLFVFMLFFYLLFVCVKLADGIYLSLKKISTSCPNCQEKYSLPTYVCVCGAEHTHLVPSKYGAFRRKCKCGRILKTTFFNGRQKLPGKWICPKCGYELGGPLQVDIPIPVVGGASSGKTCFISMAISQIEKMAPSLGLEFSYNSNPLLEDDYEENIRALDSGNLPSKSDYLRLRYYQFYLTPNKEKVKNLISICDIAGEAYEGGNNSISGQLGFKYANAFIMVIDPLSIRRYREEVAGDIALDQYRASERSMDEVLDSLITTLENINCLTPQNMIKTDVAVLFTKCDIPGLNDKIGPKVVEKYMQQHEIKSKYEATNKVCEKFLNEYEEDNFLNSLKSKFKSIQFFTCSALGHVVNGQEFEPSGVVEPALWLIDKASASINLKSIWGKKI